MRQLACRQLRIGRAGVMKGGVSVAGLMKGGVSVAG